MGVKSKLLLLPANGYRCRRWLKKLLRPIIPNNTPTMEKDEGGVGNSRGNMIMEEEEDEKIMSSPPSPTGKIRNPLCFSAFTANSWSRRSWRRWKQRRPTLLRYFHDFAFHVINFIEAFVLVGTVCCFYCCCAGCHI